MRNAERVVRRTGGNVESRAGATHAAAAVDAAPEGPREPLWRQVVGEVRWAFAPPRFWLGGMAFNLVMALVWMIAVPLTGGHHRDWPIIVGSYFAVWILADVTTTNALGADALRVRIGLLRAVGLRRMLLVKNLALLVIVGLPTLVATGILTIANGPDYRLALTLPGVLFPILTWLGVGNVASVLLPVATVPWRERWRQRRQLRSTGRWLVSLALPYALLGAVDPVSELPRAVLRNLRFLRPTVDARGAVLCVLALAIWGVGTGLALWLNRLRPIRIR